MAEGKKSKKAENAKEAKEGKAAKAAGGKVGKNKEASDATQAAAEKSAEKAVLEKGRETVPEGGKEKTQKRKKQGRGHKDAPKREAWVDYKPEDVEKLVVGLGKGGQNASEIGMALRDQYAVPSVKAITGKRIERILADAGMKPDLPRDVLNLIRKSVTLMNHLKENKKDMTAKRGYQITVSKIRRLAKYYIKKRRMPSTWRYSPEEAMLLVK